MCECVCVCAHLDYYLFTCVLPCLFLPISFSSEAYCPLLLQLQSWQRHHNTHLLSHLLSFLCCTQEESCGWHTARLHRWSKEKKDHDRRLLIQAEGLQCMVITAPAASSCPPWMEVGGRWGGLPWTGTGAGSFEFDDDDNDHELVGLTILGVCQGLVKKSCDPGMVMLKGHSMNDTVNWCTVVWCPLNRCQDSSSFRWHQPCNKQRCKYITAVGIQKGALQGYSHSFTITQQIAVSLL